MADQIPFTRGVPSADLLPIDHLRAAAASALQHEAPMALSYSGGAGHPGLRAWIAARHGVDAESVVCTNGSLQAFAFVAELLLRSAKGRRVVVEAPTYDRSLICLQRLGAEIVSVPVDADGLDVAALERELASGETPVFVYTIPNFQNPSGATLSAARRTRLVELADEHDFTIVEDDPYGLLRWAGASPASLLATGGRRRVVSMSSFTKTVAPGLRVGYAIAPDDLRARLVKHANDTYIAPGMLAESTLAAYLEAGHFEPHVQFATAELQRRCAALVEGVSAHFPPQRTFVAPDGGYFLWVELPGGPDCSRLLELATAAGVPFVKGSDFYDGAGGEHAMRLAFSAVSTEQIAEGAERLGRVIASA
jgi:2-aminoadipate transaminase